MFTSREQEKRRVRAGSVWTMGPKRIRWLGWLKGVLDVVVETIAVAPRRLSELGAAAHESVLLMKRCPLDLELDLS